MTDPRFSAHALRVSSPQKQKPRIAALLAVCGLIATTLCVSPAPAQDDAYRGPPPTGGGFQDQMRRQGYDVPPQPQPQGGGEGGGLRGGGGGPAGEPPGGSGGSFSSDGLRGTQRQGTVAPIPIAVPVFTGEDPKLAADVAQVVMADLERSGLFQPLDQASFLET